MFQQKQEIENGLRGFLVGWFKFGYIYESYNLKQVFPFEYLMLSVVV